MGNTSLGALSPSIFFSVIFHNPVMALISEGRENNPGKRLWQLIPDAVTAAELLERNFPLKQICLLIYNSDPSMCSES